MQLVDRDHYFKTKQLRKKYNQASVLSQASSKESMINAMQDTADFLGKVSKKKGQNKIINPSQRSSEFRELEEI